MEDAKLKNLVICQPEHRNRFNKIFGGFIMRQAFELGWANAYVFAKERPFIVYMDDISFEAPVEVGSLLYFNSQVSTLLMFSTNQLEKLFFLNPLDFFHP